MPYGEMTKLISGVFIDDFITFRTRPTRVLFNAPATIVFWNDKTKTVVVAQNGEKFDKEKGLALCFMKKFLGNKGNYNNEFRKWL